MFGVDLGKYNGDASWTLFLPARTIIGTDGVIRDAAASSSRINPNSLFSTSPESMSGWK